MSLSFRCAAKTANVIDFHLFPSNYSTARHSISIAEFTSVFIVEGKPREAEGIVKIIKESRHDALQVAKDFLEQGLPFVSIIGDDHVYTIEEFSLTIINDPSAYMSMCPRCNGCGWVCENHPERPWSGKQACKCGGAGMPCYVQSERWESPPRLPTGFEDDDDATRH